METINNFEKSNINRGVELILRKKGGDKTIESNCNKFNFEKTFSFFKREITFKIEFKVIKEK